MPLQAEGRVMGDDDRELVNRLFAAATAMLEDAALVAVEGQSPSLGPSRLADCGRRLQAAAHDITAIAEACTVIADRGDGRRRGRPNRSH